MSSRSGKSSRGRGGRGRTHPFLHASSSPRFSSESSNPSTSSSRPSVSHLSPLPPQYNFTPNSISETQSPFSTHQQPPLHVPNPPSPDHVDSPPPQNHAPPPRNHQQQPPITLDDVLNMPGWEIHLLVLSPIRKGNTIWFGRDKGKVVRKISKILKHKFDGEYYCWTVVPVRRQDQYFIEFAHSYTWDPVITDTVREEFDNVCLRRMKGMVSTTKRSGKRPNWISMTRWKSMCDYWATPVAKGRSSKASKARNSPHGDLGAHKHLSGQKSYIQIQDEMEEELKRKVSIGYF